jgi:hypothetical protein
VQATTTTSKATSAATAYALRKSTPPYHFANAVYQNENGNNNEAGNDNGNDNEAGNDNQAGSGNTVTFPSVFAKRDIVRDVMNTIGSVTNPTAGSGNEFTDNLNGNGNGNGNGNEAGVRPPFPVFTSITSLVVEFRCECGGRLI